MGKPGRFITPDQPPVSYDAVRLFIPHEQTWIAIALGQWDLLGYARIFEQTTGVSAEYAAKIFSSIWFSLTEREGFMFSGMIVPAARSTAPNDNWLFCDGAAYLISQYPALFNAIGTTFGNDGEGTFRVPDLRGRFPLAAGQGTGLTNRALAASGGEESHLLTTTEIPSHRHSIRVVSGTGAYYGWKPGVTEGALDGEDTGLASGGGQSHNNMPPFLALSFFIFTGEGCGVA